MPMPIPDSRAEPRHSTRQARCGTVGSKVEYNRKFHPMDRVTAPNRAAKHLAGFEPPKNNIKTDEESLPSSTSDCDPEQAIEYPTERACNPRAVRHSSRTEAKKLVNYSAKYLPQDNSLPGYEHKEKQLRKWMDSQALTLSSNSKLRKKRPTERSSQDVDQELDEPRLSKKSRRTSRVPEDTRPLLIKRKALKRKAQAFGNRVQRSAQSNTSVDSDEASSGIDEDSVQNLERALEMLPSSNDAVPKMETHNASRSGLTSPTHTTAGGNTELLTQRIKPLELIDSDSDHGTAQRSSMTFGRSSQRYTSSRTLE